MNGATVDTLARRLHSRQATRSRELEHEGRDVEKRDLNQEKDPADDPRLLSENAIQGEGRAVDCLAHPACGVGGDGVQGAKFGTGDGGKKGERSSRKRSVLLLKYS